MVSSFLTSPIVMGAVGSLLAGLATVLGALPIFLVRRISARLQDFMLAFAAGVMLSASFFSLILPGLEFAQAQGATKAGATLIIGTAILLGAAAIWSIHRYTPHEHFLLGYQGPDSKSFTRIWLFVFAITLHNFPEGMAVGVGFGGGNTANGIAIALGIGLQNIPEGLAVAVALLTVNYTRLQAMMVALITGLVEPIGGIIGIAAVTIAETVLPWGLGFSAGAMLFIISDEIIPETHRRGNETIATFGLMIGVVVMMLLDVILG